MQKQSPCLGKAEIGKLLEQLTRYFQDLVHAESSAI